MTGNFGGKNRHNLLSQYIHSTKFAFHIVYLPKKVDFVSTIDLYRFIYAILKDNQNKFLMYIYLPKS